MKDLLFAQGSLQNVLKRIGEYKSNVFCIGEDPTTKSGVIVSNGEIVSSRILDVKLKNTGLGEGVLSFTTNYLNTIEVKYIDVASKSIQSMSFNILNNEALDAVVKVILENQQIDERLQNIEKNIIISDEKVKKIQEFLAENKDKIECIGDIKNQIIDMNNKLDILLTERSAALASR